MRIHFIAIGGSAMHNLAIALKLKGYDITGSDDVINDPSKSRLDTYGLLPENEGWFCEKITNDNRLTFFFSTCKIRRCSAFQTVVCLIFRIFV